MHARILPWAVVFSLGCGGDDDPSGTQTSTGSSSSTADSSGGNTTAVTHDSHGESASGSSSSVGTGESSTSSGGVESSSGGSTTSGAQLDTWANWAHPSFFSAFCIQCHPGDSSRDFNDYAVVLENVEHIRCGVAPEALRGCAGTIDPAHLPIGPGPYPTDDERWRLVDWIDAGLPE